MIPPTKNGLPSMGCLSAMQKCIRRGMEREAMEFACELIHTSKSFNTMVCNRLQIISQEDIDTEANPHIVPFVRVSCEQAIEWYNEKRLGKTRMCIGNAIRMMAHAKKSRLGDHFQAAIGLRAELKGFTPTIPDWANDGHTLQGKKLGRGAQFFIDESTKLVPDPGPDAYADEAAAMWKLREKNARLV